MPAGGAVRIDGNRIELDPGVRLDLGGIGKGYAAERAAEPLATAGPCLVNAGGDIATRGGSWPVGVTTGDGTLTLELTPAARSRRRAATGARGGAAGRALHHLIDPSTGEPAASDVMRITVVAGDAVDAEVLATSLFLAGMDAAAAAADAAGVPAVIVGEDGRTLLAGGLA